MTVIPVVDVKNGEVVRASGGSRANYELLESDLCPTGEPLPFAFALQERFGCREIYIADLDAIAGAAPNINLIHELLEIGMIPWVDVGVRDVADAERIRQAGASVVVGSETLKGLDAWERIVRAIDGRRLAFSLDLRNGQPITTIPCGNSIELISSIKSIAEEVRADGPSRWIVLDLAQVGCGAGIGTEKLLQQLLDRFPNLQLYAGGGIRGHNDLVRLKELGLAGVLASSAIHAGVIQPGDQS